MRLTTRFTSVTAALVMLPGLLALGACGADEQDNPLGLITPDTIQVASIGDAKPYTFTDDKGEFTGFDVEYFTEVAHHAGIENVEFAGQDFSAILSGVANGQFDVGAAAIGITNERKETVDFTHDYLAGYLTLLTKKDAGISSIEDTAGHRIGVVQGSLQEQFATKNFKNAEIVRFPDNNTAISGLNTGTIDGHFLDFEAAQDYADEYDLVHAFDEPSFDAPAGFAVAKDNDALEEALNKGVDETIADGTWKELYEKWFPGSPIPDKYQPTDEK